MFRFIIIDGYFYHWLAKNVPLRWIINQKKDQDKIIQQIYDKIKVYRSWKATYALFAEWY